MFSNIIKNVHSKVPKICIKYRKHWKSYASFQLSRQMGKSGWFGQHWLFTSIFNNILTLEKVGVTPLKAKKHDDSSKWLQKLIDFNHKNIFLMNKKPLCIILNTSLCKDIKRKLELVKWVFIISKSFLFSSPVIVLIPLIDL